jgi:hypothetical protein
MAYLIRDNKTEGFSSPEVETNWKQKYMPTIPNSETILRREHQKLRTIILAVFRVASQVILVFFWQHINNLNSQGVFENRVLYDGKPYEGVEAAQTFPNFSRIFLPGVPLLDPYKTIQQDETSTANLIHIGTTSLQDVEAGIARLRPQSSLGPDAIPVLILKGCKDWLVQHLCHTFSLALRTGE